jgi:hypothetical protein
VHCATEGQATPYNVLSRSTTLPVEAPGSLGSNVSSSPSAPTAVHCTADGHATAFNREAATVVDTGLRGFCGSNVTSPPLSATATHVATVGHASAFKSAGERSSGMG